MSAAGPLTHTPEGVVYEVFGNFRSEGMHHLGSVIAGSDALARMYAAKLYDEWTWTEMHIIRRDKIQTLIEAA
jgi:hypothetical protein